MRGMAPQHEDPARSYRSPLETRNASAAMRAAWSDHRRFSTWRRVWLALARAQHELGLGPTAEQVAAIESVLDSIDLDAAARHERELRHDVMAHVHTLGDAAPAARAIIHLGATSQDVVCNADALLQRDALRLTAQRLARAIDRLAAFADRWKSEPALGFTHYQPAQPVTVGRRAAQWAQDFAVALAEVELRLEGQRLRGLRGATGTQASYLALCRGDAAKVERLERAFAAHLGWDPARLWPLTAQTYPRIADAQLLSSLSVAACAVHKCATDIRLLCNLRELDEPFEQHQIGSSAMPYKRNPMRCERATGLARFVMSLAHNAYDTAATQWLERTLDDSSNRRLSIPESFLALDGALEIMANVAGGLVVYPRQVSARLAAELPFLATEEIMLAAVARGADRQDAHEAIRRHAQAAAHRVKAEGAPNDLLARLRSDPMFAGCDLDAVVDPSRYIGLARTQVEAFLRDVAGPVRARHADALNQEPELRV